MELFTPAFVASLPNDSGEGGSEEDEQKWMFTQPHTVLLHCQFSPPDKERHLGNNLEPWSWLRVAENRSRWGKGWAFPFHPLLLQIYLSVYLLLYLVHRKYLVFVYLCPSHSASEQVLQTAGYNAECTLLAEYKLLQPFKILIKHPKRTQQKVW